MTDARHLTCQELVELVTSYLEQRLAPDEATLFEEHLMFCGACEAYVEQMRATVAALGRVAEAEQPPESVLAAFREWRRA